MTPFDKAKSSSSSKGLEVREVFLSEVLANKDARIDSQFFTMAQSKNPKLHYRRLGELLVSSEYGLSNEMNEDGKGYPIYRMNEMHSMLCDLGVAKCADINASEAKEFLLRDGDLLFNRTNSYELVGRCGVFYGAERGEKVFASYLVRLNTNKDLLLPECAAALLNTRYGVQEIRRRARQSINQTNVNPEEVKEIEVPAFEMGFQLRIKDAFRTAYQCLVEAEGKYKEAEADLLSELGFSNWHPTNDGASVKSFSEMINAGRIDAEYFQPKFDEIEARILNRATDVLCAADALIAGLCKSDDEKVERYIELADIGASGTVESCTKAEFVDLPSRARQRVSKGQVIVSSIEGSLKSSALITSEYDGALCSTGFHRFRTDKINPETLLLLFKSWPIQELLKRGCSGTILSGISADSLENIPLPILPQRIQASLADKVRESFRLRNESKRLLDLAKSAVELAIEKGEDAALSYMTHNGT